MAVQADVNRKHLSELERGEHDPRASTMLKLASGLGRSCGELGAAVDEELVLLEAREDPSG